MEKREKSKENREGDLIYNNDIWSLDFVEGPREPAQERQRGGLLVSNLIFWMKWKKSH